MLMTMVEAWGWGRENALNKTEEGISQLFLIQVFFRIDEISFWS